MDVVMTRCAGWMCIRRRSWRRCGCPERRRRSRRVVTETFGTMTADLIALREWLQAYGVTHVALESTGVYWKPVYYVLEDAFTLLLINMQELKHVPGRKTDVKDSEWLAQLLECGLLQASFVPPPPIRELRDLTRYRVQQVRDRAHESQSAVQGPGRRGGEADARVATDVMGASGRAMLDALVAGTTDPTVLADLARGKLRRETAGAAAGAAGAVSRASRVSAGADLGEDRLPRRGARAAHDRDRRATRPFRADADRPGHDSGR